MIKKKATSFEGLDCIQLANEELSMWITTQVGPRILGLSLTAGENLMAVLPDAKIPVEGRDDYSLRGGHRLWYGPENPLTTYLRDDQPVEIETLEKGVSITQPIDQDTGIQKSLQIQVDEDQAVVTLDHSLTNHGDSEFELTPWAVTMLRPGGVGAIPLQTERDDPHGLWPNRELVLWPYTEISSPFLALSDRAIFVRAQMEDGALKIGAPNPLGWLAYQWKGTLFIKRAAYQAGRKYLDRGASSQIYCGPPVIELETLGPVVRLKPGESTDHQEIWQVYREGSWPEEIKEIYTRVMD